MKYKILSRYLRKKKCKHEYSMIIGKCIKCGLKKIKNIGIKDL